MVAGKPLYVAFAQRKEDRRARLQVILMKWFGDHLFVYIENNLLVKKRCK